VSAMQCAQRPALTSLLSAAEFERWYWLKEELVAFCRVLRLPTSGGKLSIARRIAAHLDGKAAPRVAVVPRRSATMPSEFDLDMQIGEGWRCSQPLRAFFEQHCGRGFRFNEAMRTFIASRAGSTLRDAIAYYHSNKYVQPDTIAAQFEYNHHVRDYRAAHPDAAHAEVVRVWREKRSQPRRDESVRE
jgi:SAP domain-containing new25/Domain of unknown function (DUF6434)